MTDFPGTKVGDTSTTGTSPLTDADPVGAAPTGSSYGTTTPSASPSTGGSAGGAGTTAQGVAQDAAAGGKQTAETAKEQAAEVAQEAKSQARALVDQARQQLTEQTGAQQEKAATGLHSIADELTGMLEGQGANDGLAAELAQQASTRVRDAASWLESRQPSDLLDEVRSFARRRPGTFLLGAAALGVVGGRLTRGLAADASDGSGATGSTGGSLEGSYGGTGTGTYAAAQPALVDPVLPVVDDATTSGTSATTGTTPTTAVPSAAPTASGVTGEPRFTSTPGAGEDRI